MKKEKGNYDEGFGGEQHKKKVFFSLSKLSLTTTNNTY